MRQRGVAEQRGRQDEPVGMRQRREAELFPNPGKGQGDADGFSNFAVDANRTLEISMATAPSTGCLSRGGRWRRNQGFNGINPR